MEHKAELKNDENGDSIDQEIGTVDHRVQIVDVQNDHGNSLQIPNDVISRHLVASQRVIDEQSNSNSIGHITSKFIHFDPPKHGKQHSPKPDPPKHRDPKWSQKRVGILSMEYTMNAHCSIDSVDALRQSINDESITVHGPNVVDDVLDDLMDQYRPRNTGTLTAELEFVSNSKITAVPKTKSARSPCDRDDGNNEKIEIGNFESLSIDAQSGAVSSDSNRCRLEVMVIVRRTIKDMESMTSALGVDPPSAIPLGTTSREIVNDYNELEALRQSLISPQWKESELTLPKLLDFCCRFEYDENDKDQNYWHGLNVVLHQFQLQTLRWMMDIEDHPLGVYREFYKMAHFEDGTPYHYSSLFQRMIIDGKVPSAHGGMICSEMGLGKTICALALIGCRGPSAEDLDRYSTESVLRSGHEETVYLQSEEFDEYVGGYVTVTTSKVRTWYKSRATLVIAPVSLVPQWETEIREKVERTLNDGLSYKRYHGARSRDLRKWVDVDIVLTTYPIFGKEDGTDPDKHILHHIEWHRIILDESLSIKKQYSKATKSIFKLRARNKWCLTGTPFGNRIEDIKPQLEFIGIRRDDLSVIRQWELDANGIVLPHSALPLIRVMKGSIMRHRISQLFNGRPILNMPEPANNVILIDFEPEQRQIYDSLYAAAKELYDCYEAIAGAGRGTIRILAALQPVRQACSGYICSREDIETQLATIKAKTSRFQQFTKCPGDVSIAMAEEEAFDDLDGECPICMECPYDDPLQTPCNHIFCRECIVDWLQSKNECPNCRATVEPNDLKQPMRQKQDDNVLTLLDETEYIRFDAKTKRLMVELERIRSERPNDKSLIFTSFTKSMKWICSELEHNGFGYRTLSGDMSMNKRKKQLEEFAKDDNVKVFVLTVRAGAVGITLTAANHVFITEPLFNQSLYRQAINRAYRLGQEKKVFIYNMMMRDSVEQRIWNINQEKHGEDHNVQNRNASVSVSVNDGKNPTSAVLEIGKLFL